MLLRNNKQAKRDKLVKIRVTEVELSDLKQRSRKPRLAEWIREHCLNVKPPKASKVPPVDPALLRQLAGIGNNLNQVARSVNAKYSPMEGVDVIARLIAIERALFELREAHSSNDC